jgi:small subunit ribosomal protein S14
LFVAVLKGNPVCHGLNLTTGGQVAKTSLIVKSKRPPRFKTQQHNRCQLCGRPRAFIRRFTLCRICFRKLALAGEIPGITKASW